MKNSRTNNRQGQEYLVMYKVFVQADGSTVVVFGNQRLEVTADEVCALIYGTLEYAKVFSMLHKQIDTTTLAILSESGIINGG